MKHRSFLLALGLSLSSLVFSSLPPRELDFLEKDQLFTLCGRDSNKSCFEQFLDVVKKNPRFGKVGLDTPYRYVGDIVDAQNIGKEETACNPYVKIGRVDRSEIPAEYSDAVEKELMGSNLLVAAARAQVYHAAKAGAIIPTQDHGLWQCSGNACWRMDAEELKELSAKK